MNNKLRVLQIIPDLRVGGAEIMVENLTLKLKKKGHDVEIVSLYDNQSVITKRLEKDGIQIHYLGKRRGLDFKIIFKLYNLYKEKKPKIIHTHLHSLIYSSLASFFLKTSCARVHTVHSIAAKESGRYKGFINGILYRFNFVKPVAIAPSIKKTIMQKYSLPDSKVKMVYNGIDFKNFIPKVSYKIINEQVNITHVGNFKEAKNHRLLIESFKLIHKIFPQAILNLIGSGELLEDVKKKVGELGLEKNVMFIGEVVGVSEYLHKADIFVLPSLWEGMPISLIEAMGTGLPIVATKVGGIVDMIENNVSGILVDVSCEQIAAAVLKLINDDGLRKRLGEEARLMSEKFSAIKMAKAYIELYKS